MVKRRGEEGAGRSERGGGNRRRHRSGRAGGRGGVRELAAEEQARRWKGFVPLAALANTL